MCNNAVRTVKKKSKYTSLDFCGIKMYLKLACANKVVPITEVIMFDNWSSRDLNKSLKTSLSMWLVTYDYTSEKPKQSETQNILPQYKRAIISMVLCCVPVNLGLGMGWVVLMYIMFLSVSGGEILFFNLHV